MARPSKTDLYRPRDSFAVQGPNGHPVVFSRVDILRGDHWAIKGREELFEQVDESVAYEQATAAPGEVRTLP